MRLFIAIVGALCVVLFNGSEAAARRVKQLPGVLETPSFFNIFQPPANFTKQRNAPTRNRIGDWSTPRHAGVGPRPGRWCGWFMQHDTGVTSAGTGLNLNRAIMWARVGQPTSPRVGAIVVWRHHVGRIVGGEPGAWVVRSGNDGRAVRERVRRLDGAVAFRAL